MIIRLKLIKEINWFFKTKTKAILILCMIRNIENWSRKNSKCINLKLRLKRLSKEKINMKNKWQIKKQKENKTSLIK